MMPVLLSMEALEADRRYVERQIAEAGDSPWGTARLMWQSRLADIDQQIAALSAGRSNYASVAVIFDGNPVIGSGDIRLDFTTEALDSYQKVVALALASQNGVELSERGRLPAGDQARLFIRDLVRGSMGFILEELPGQQHEMLPTQLKEAVEDTTQLIANLSAASDAEFEATLAGTQPRLVAAVQKFAKVLFDAGASTRIVGDEQRLALSVDEVGRLSRRLGEVEVTEEVVPVDGVLLGVLPEARKFELKLLEGTMEGAVSEDLAFKYTSDAAFKERLLLQPVRAQVKFVRTKRNGRLVKERRILEALEPTAE
ncbi:hypothetical protein O4J55_19265 [Paracoccus sp. PXZ]